MLKKPIRHLLESTLVKQWIIRLCHIFMITFSGAVIILGLGMIEIKQGDLKILNQFRIAHTAPFPIGVNPQTELIIEQPEVEEYRRIYLAEQTPDRDNLFTRLFAALTHQQWYQNTTSLSGRTVVIFPGERKEEIVRNFGAILKWSTLEKEAFLNQVASVYPDLPEGVYMPGTYVVHRDADPDTIAKVITDAFTREIYERYPNDIAEQIPLEKALIIASLIERETNSFEDMRIISGVIWNRLFANMRLQLDATLQYAKSPPQGPYWTVPKPNDKHIKSPYNTYRIYGLPPAAISNPSASAVLAALNPIKTDCIFYFHAYKKIYCSTTYDEHRRKIRSVFGTQ